MAPRGSPGDKSAAAVDVAANECALVFAGDDAFGPGLAVAMHSALANLAPACHPEVCVLDNGLSESSRRRLRKVVRAARSIDDVRWIPMTRERLGKVAAGSHLTPASYSRLLIPDLLPRIRRAVYLDADVIVRGDISPLFTIDLGGAPIGAVRDFLVTSTADQLCGVRERAHPRPYFNAGVLAIDVARWKAERITDRAMRYADAGEPLRFADQDALNALNLHWYELDFQWNVQEQRDRHLLVGERRRAVVAGIEGRLDRTYHDLGRAALVLHFVGETKPWQHCCLTPGTAAWVRTLLRTRWYSPRQALTWLLRRYRTLLPYVLRGATRRVRDACADTVVAVGGAISRRS